MNSRLNIYIFQHHHLPKILLGILNKKKYLADLTRVERDFIIKNGCAHEEVCPWFVIYQTECYLTKS